MTMAIALISFSFVANFEVDEFAVDHDANVIFHLLCDYRYSWEEGVLDDTEKLEQDFDAELSVQCVFLCSVRAKRRRDDFLSVETTRLIARTPAVA